MGRHFSLDDCLRRLRAGEDVRDDLIELTARRLRRLASQMFHRDDRLRRWVDSADVFQNACLRIWGALSVATPKTPTKSSPV